MRILSAAAQPAGATAELGFGGMKSQPLPAHCEITGILHERKGQDGENYAIRFHLRLPDDWNGRFLFEGGGGTDGNIGGALGMIKFGAPPAIAEGYAVVSDDAGHSNQINNDSARGGNVSFGLDAQARADYGHASLKATYDAAQAIIAGFYGRAPEHSYFAGCSKGGQEGLAFAERYPASFDGILAGAPGMSLPKAAIGHPWVVQGFAAVLGDIAKSKIPVSRLADSISDSDLRLARRAILDACDADDGLKDGIVGAFSQCTNEKVIPELEQRMCRGGEAADCLIKTQIAAIERFYHGPHESKGNALYANFPWDGGLADTGWRAWTVGVAAHGNGDGRTVMPPGGLSIAVTMGAGALAEVFSTPPEILPPGPQAAFDYLLSYDFDKDPSAIFATSDKFPRSAWEDINSRSPDLDAFIKHGGKLLIYQGVSDPVFSINDTIAWLTEVKMRMNDRADDTVRLFPVPGMGHCMGGPATGDFDGFDALVNWVEKGRAPDRLKAGAGPGTPWPGRTRPLCAYPKIAVYQGSGDIERAENFVCAAPRSSE